MGQKTIAFGIRKVFLGEKGRTCQNGFLRTEMAKDSQPGKKKILQVDYYRLHGLLWFCSVLLSNER